MRKHLQKMLLIVALLVPWATQAQVACGTGTPDTVTNLPAGTTASSTTSYFPGYSLYNYSYTEVIIPSSQLNDGDISEIKGLMFKPASTTAGTYFNNCTIYLANTDVVNLSSGFITDVSDYVQVYAGSLNYTSTDWQTVEFDDTFTWDGSSNIVVAVKRDHGTYTSGSSFTAFSASSSLARYVYQDSGPYTPGSVSGGTATSTVPWYKLLGCSGAEVSCNRVRGLAASGVLSDELTLSWIDTLNSGATYTIYALAADTTIVASNLSTDSYTITGLSPNTLYTFAVVTDCGSDGESVYSKITVRTTCSFIEESMLPVTENFETYGSGTTAFPSCWTKIGSTADRPYIHATTSYGHNNTYGLYFYAAASGYCYGVMPPVDPTVDLTTLQVSFWARQYSTSYNCDFVVGVMSSPTDITTFTPVGQVHPNGTTYEFFEIPLTSYTGTGNYIAFQSIQHPGTSTGIYLMLDDVTLDYTPDCPTPMSINADSVASDAVNLYWEDPINSEWLLIYGPTGFNPDTAVVNVLTLTDTTTLVSNLTANTSYDFYLAALCVDGDTTMFRMISVRTACEPINILPYSEDFDTYGTGTTAFPSCWYKLGSTADRPYINSSTTYGNNGTYGLYFYAAAGGYCYGVMPPVDPTLDLSTLQVSFWARQYSTSYDCDFIVGLMTNPTDATTFTPVSQVHPTGTTYEYFEVPLSAYTGTGNFIAFQAVQHPGTSTAIYLMLDDVTLETVPTCPGVANLESNATVGSAMLTWQTRSSVVGEVQNYTIDVTDSADVTTTYTTSDMYYILTGLTAGSEYKVVVTPDCGSDGLGHSDSVVFHTGALTCLELDETTMDTIAFSNSTSGISGCLAYSSYGNTVYQTIYTAAELTAAGVTAGPVIGIDLGFTACTNYNKEFTIFIGNSNTTSISNATMEDPNNQLQVYGPASHPMNTTGWQHYDFTTPFMWDGVSSIIVTTFMNQSGGSQSSSTGLTGYYVSATNKARYRYRDSSPFTLSDFNSGNAGSTYSYRAAIHFYQGECMTMASCAAPDVEVTDLQSDEATISWLPGYDETEWDIYYRQAGESTWTNAASGVSTTSYTFTNLTSATDYEFLVSFDCSGDNETYSSVVSASTLCDDVTLPYIQGFENVTTSTSSTNYGVMPNCWDYILTGSSSYTTGSYLPGVYYSSSYANTGNYCLRLAGKGYFMLPPVATSLDSVMFSMNCYITSSGYNIEVGVMEANGTFVPISQHVLTTSQHTPIEVSFASYTGNSRVIALHNYNSTYDYSYVYVDDITVDYLPDCPRIDGVTVNNISQNEATIHWTVSSVGDYEVLVGLAGFTPGDSIPVLVNNADSIDITNLSPSTAYDVYVREVCQGGGYGAWSFVHTFRTECGPITVLPYFEGFESYPVGSSTATMYEIPCWARLDNAGQNHFGYVNNSSSWAAGPHTGDKFLYYYLPSTATTHADWLLTILPTIDTNVYPMNTLQMSFWVRMNSASTTSFIEVGVISDVTDQTTFTPVDTVPVSGDVHTLKTAYLSNFAGFGNRIAMRFHRTTESTAHYFFVDDITIEPIPDCPPVSNISLTRMTSDSLYVTWTENGDATSWTVEYGPSDFTPGTGTTEVVTSLPFEIGDLLANTAYDVYITPDCDNGVAGTRVGTFRTDCGPTPVPFTENFDTWSSTTSDPLPNCWDKHTNYSTNYPYASTSYNHGNGSGKSMYMYSTNTTYSYMVLPSFDLPIDSTMISFWLYKSNTSYAHKLQVGVMTDPADVTTFVQVAEVIPSLSSAWEEIEVPLSSYNGNGTRIAIMSPNNEYSYPYLDDLRVDRISGCQRIVDLMASSVMLDSAIVTWSDGSNNSWYVEYDVVDFTPGTTPGHNLISVTDTFCVLDGLDSATTYYVYVYPDCDTVVAERHITFTTLAAAPATVPFSCNFEAAGVNGWDLINDQANYWVVGNATGNAGRSMYITDNGSTNSYSGDAAYSFAVRTFSLQAGNYVFSFDWKCQGESSYDFIRAALVPAGTNIVAGGYSGFDNASAMPVGSIALDGAYRLNLQGTSWQTEITEFTLDNPGTYKLVFLWRNDGSVYNQPPAAIDNVQLALNNCPMPQNIVLDNLAQTSVDISWEEVGSASQWEYQLSNNASVVVYDTFCTLNGLTANTAYSFRVRSICGAGDTGMWAAYNFRTACSYITVPYSQDFENEPTGSSSTGSAFVNCWNLVNNGTSYGGYPYVSSSSSYNHTVGGSQGLYWYNTTTVGTYGDYQCVVLPPVDPAISVDSLQLSFWAKASSASYVPVFQIGVMTDPNNISTFVGVDTITISSGTTWMNVEVPLVTYAGTGRYVAVKADRPSSSWYAYVDDFFLDYVPTCLAPQGLSVTASTTTSITLDWTDLSAASQWEVEYTGNGATNTTFVSAHPYTLNNLPSSTAYSFRVRAICSVGDTSYWTMTENAATQCDLVSLPYIEDFENYTGTTYSTDGILPVCWDGYSNGSTAAYFPHITGSGSYWYPHGGANALTMTSGSATYGDTKIVVLPSFDQPMNTLSMTYWYKMESATNGSTLYVGYVTGLGYDTSFVPLKTVTSTTTLTRDSISFDTVPSTATNIAFMWYYNTSFYSVGIDDIEVTSSGVYCNAPTVLPATDITYNSATVNWNGNATDYEVAIKAATDAIWPAEVAVANSFSLPVNGLQPETQYQFRVRAICDATENLISDWVEGTFTTADLPCFTPENLQAVGTGYTTATLAWTADASQNLWSIHVWNSTFDTNYEASNSTFTVTGLKQTLQYNAAVKSICGGGLIESEYGDTIQFTTATCARVTGVNATNITTNSALVSWTPAGVSTYIIEYGDRNFSAGSGTTVTVENETSYTLTGLDDDWEYSVLVKAVCEPGVEGEWSVRYDFATPEETTAVNTVEGGMNLAIYPNPTSDATTIALSGVNGEVNITIVDMNGRIVKSETMSCEGDCTKRMEVSGLAQGAYFVRVNGEDLNMVRKLVVK